MAVDWHLLWKESTDDNRTALTWQLSERRKRGRPKDGGESETSLVGGVGGSCTGGEEESRMEELCQCSKWHLAQKGTMVMISIKCSYNHSQLESNTKKVGFLCSGCRLMDRSTKNSCGRPEWTVRKSFLGLSTGKGKDTTVYRAGKDVQQLGPTTEIRSDRFGGELMKNIQYEPELNLTGSQCSISWKKSQFEQIYCMPELGKKKTGYS